MAKALGLTIDQAQAPGARIIVSKYGDPVSTRRRQRRQGRREHANTYFAGAKLRQGVLCSQPATAVVASCGHDFNRFTIDPCATAKPLRDCQKMSTPEGARQKAAAAYNAASDFYDHPVNSFWERYGGRTVARVGLGAGARVLDVCCGSGASAIPAAEVAGPSGFVLGVDLAENLIALARAKAKHRGLENIAFRVGDMLELDQAAASFDAVICVFGIFFVPDMPAAVRKLWECVRPGGQLAITTWGPRFLEPVNTVFWESVRAVRPDLHKGFNPWDRISEPDALRAIFLAAGAEAPDVVPEMSSHPLGSPEDWWPIVLGTGYRGTVEQLEPEARRLVREQCLDFIRTTGVQSVEANVVYASATKRPAM